MDVEQQVDFSQIKGLPGIPQKPAVLTLNVEYTAAGVIVPGDSNYSAETGSTNFEIASMPPESYGMILHSADISCYIDHGSNNYFPVLSAMMDIELDNRNLVDKSDYNREINATVAGGIWTALALRNRITIVQGTTKWLSISEVFEIRSASIILEFNPIPVGANGNLLLNLTLNYQIPTRISHV